MDRFFLRTGTAIGAALLAVVLAGPGAAQDVNTQRLVDTVDRLERQLRTLERQVYRGEAPAASNPAPVAGGIPEAAVGMPEPAAARLQVRLDDFEKQVRKLTGQLQEIGFQVRSASTRLDKLVADVDYRLRVLEGGDPAAPRAARAPATTAPGGETPGIVTESVVVGEEPQPPSVQTLGTVSADAVDAVRAGEAAPESATATVEAPRRAAAAAAPEPSPVAAPSAAAVETGGGVQAAALDREGPLAGTPEEQYSFARGFLMRRDFASAETALHGFLQANPGHDLAGNAQYWLGETFYVRGDYVRAARTFAEGYRHYPGSTKAPDNLLKLGMSLGRLERKEDACITLAKLKSDYADASTNILQRADRERSSLACP